MKLRSDFVSNSSSSSFIIRLKKKPSEYTVEELKKELGYDRDPFVELLNILTRKEHDLDYEEYEYEGTNSFSVDAGDELGTEDLEAILKHLDGSHSVEMTYDH